MLLPNHHMNISVSSIHPRETQQNVIMDISSFSKNHKLYLVNRVPYKTRQRVPHTLTASLLTRPLSFTYEAQDMLWWNWHFWLLYAVSCRLLVMDCYPLAGFPGLYWRCAIELREGRRRRCKTSIVNRESNLLPGWEAANHKPWLSDNVIWLAHRSQATTCQGSGTFSPVQSASFARMKAYCIGKIQIQEIRFLKGSGIFGMLEMQTRGSDNYYNVFGSRLLCWFSLSIYYMSAWASRMSDRSNKHLFIWSERLAGDHKNGICLLRQNWPT